MCNNIPQAKLSYALKCSLHMKDPDNYTLDEFIFYTYLFASTPSPPSNKPLMAINYSPGGAGGLFA